MKKYVIITMLVLMTLPFVLIRSFYPFYRFGMFAEPISKENKLESFLIFYNNPNNPKGEKKLFYAPDVGISVSVFEAIKRKYYYKKKSKELLENLQDYYSSGETANWELYRVLWESEYESDTVKIFSLSP